MHFTDKQFPDHSEGSRQAVLASLDILDTPAEREFDELTRLASLALGVASSAISLIDDKRQWFKSRQGIPFSETPREIAFCTHAVNSGELLVVPDASRDPRFSDNPLVTQKDGIRFYAGAPLIVASGHCLGTLCVFDPTARERLTEQQETILRDLARLATDLIESRRFRRMGEIAAKVVDTTTDAILAADLHGTIVYWNRAAEQMFGRSQEEAIGQSVEVLLPKWVAGKERGSVADICIEQCKARSAFIELTGVRPNGSEFPVELSLAQWGNTDGEHGFAAILRDITERKAQEQEREHAKKFLHSVVTNLPAMLFVKDVRSREYLMLNRAGEKLIGRSAHDLIGRTDRELFPQLSEGYEDRDNSAIAAAGGSTVFESVYPRDDGRNVHLRTTRTVIDGPERSGQYILGISEDVTEMRDAEAEVRRLAHFDVLTGLLNRSSYADRLHRMVQDQRPFAMLCIDIDRFKAVNDQYGHPTGDAVLKEIAERLRRIVGQAGWIARLGGDEFVVVLSEGNLREKAAQVAEEIIQSVATPFVTKRGVAYVGASIGAVLMPEDGTNTDQLRENADLALYRAKHNGKSALCFFNADMDATAQDRRKIGHDLRNAVASGEITLEYQPLISTKTGQITSVEALARWTHPTRGKIRPDVFIPMAEEGGLIDTLGERLLHRACLDAQTWPSPVRVAVNLSPMQFISDKLLDTVRSALEQSGLTPHRLLLEVTEGLVIRDVEGTFKQLERLRALGIQIVIDDFGVGYSSLSYFQRFPFDKVKIDKSFVDEITTSRAAKAIVQAVVGLGEKLGMAVVAEGVESEEQMEMLVAFGCTHLQGYLFSRPLRADALRQLLESAKAPVAARRIFAA